MLAFGISLATRSQPFPPRKRNKGKENPLPGCQPPLPAFPHKGTVTRRFKRSRLPRHEAIHFALRV